MTKRKYFPMFLDISGKKILIVGAGEVACRRIRSLLEFDVKITVLAKEVKEEIRNVSKVDLDLQIMETEVDFNAVKAEKMHSPKMDFPEVHGNEMYSDEMHLRKRGFVNTDFSKFVRDFDIILAATSNPALNSAITMAARRQGKWVNNASDQVECDFFFPALAMDGEITIGIAGDGKNHKKVSEVAKKIRDCL